jgi:hypothetical protein
MSLEEKFKTGGSKSKEKEKENSLSIENISS